MRLSFFFIVLIATSYTNAQKISEISISTNFFETQSFGNNPFTISSLMKDPVRYTNYIRNFQHESWSGTGGFYSLNKAILINASFKLNGSQNWKRKLLIQTGIAVGIEESHPTGSLSKTYLVNPTPNTSQRVFEELKISERTNHIGLSAGALYLFSPDKRVSFFTGLQFLYQFSVVHSYNSSIHRLTFTSVNGASEFMERITYDENLFWDGKTYSTSRVFVPLGFQIQAAKNYMIRPSIFLGIFLPPRPFRTMDESHGFGIQLVRKL